MKTHSHWHIILDEMKYATQAANHGYSLYKAINDKSLRGEQLKLVLTCASCTMKMYIALEKLHQTYLEAGAGAPQITCNCGYTGSHHYHGIEN